MLIFPAVFVAGKIIKYVTWPFGQRLFQASLGGISPKKKIIPKDWRCKVEIFIIM